MSVTEGVPVKVKKAYPLASTLEEPLKEETLPTVQVEPRPVAFQLLVTALQSCVWAAALNEEVDWP